MIENTLLLPYSKTNGGNIPVKERENSIYKQYLIKSHVKKHVSIRLTFLTILHTSFDTCIVWAVPEEKYHHDGSILGFILTI
jgi:hypothetical protein